MTATLTTGHVPAVHRVSVARAYRFELVKLVSQWRIRLLVLACWVVPALFVAVVSRREHSACRHPLRALDERNGVGGTAGGARFRGHLGASAGDLAGRG